MAFSTVSLRVSTVLSTLGCRQVFVTSAYASVNRRIENEERNEKLFESSTYLFVKIQMKDTIHICIHEKRNLKRYSTFLRKLNFYSAFYSAGTGRKPSCISYRKKRHADILLWEIEFISMYSTSVQKFKIAYLEI